MQAKRRVVIAKVGLDGHEAGAKMVAVLLRDAGYEVIYLGPRQTCEAVVSVAEQEDAALIGVSLLSGAHRQVAREMLKLLRERGLEIPLVIGGIIPPQDQEKLLEMGVAAALGPGTRTSDILRTVGELLGRTPQRA